MADLFVLPEGSGPGGEAPRQQTPVRGFRPQSVPSCRQRDRSPDQRIGQLLTLGRSHMTTTRRYLLCTAAAIGMAALAWAPLSARAQTAVAIDNDDIGGVVTGPKGPEAGVWVIAETKDLPTRFARMVVTDDQGRYVLPDLPAAKHKLWVRGYGLVDSAKVDAEPGKQ